MITINNFEILNSGSQLAIDVETSVGYSITSILLWDMNSFKDYSLSVNLSDRLENINNKEVFIVNATDLGILKFEDIYFIEVESDAPTEECSTCLLPALGITYSLLPYYQCMLNYLLKTDIVSCKDTSNKNLLVTINLLIDSIPISIDLGYYIQAIASVNKLKKLCSLNQCTNCNTVKCNSCSQFRQS